MEYKNDFGEFGVIVTPISIFFTKGENRIRVPSDFLNQLEDKEGLTIHNIYFDFVFRNPMQLNSHSKKIFETIAFIFDIDLKKLDQ